MENFILYMAITLREEEMMTRTPFHRYPASGWMASLSLTYGVSDAVSALPSHLTGHGVKDPRRSQDPPIKLTLLLESLQPATSHSPISPLPTRIFTRSPRAVNRLYTDLPILVCVLLSLRSIRVTSHAHLPIGYNHICNTLHLPRVNRLPQGL